MIHEAAFNQALDEVERISLLAYHAQGLLNVLGSELFGKLNESPSLVQMREASTEAAIEKMNLVCAALDDLASRMIASKTQSLSSVSQTPPPFRQPVN